MPVLSVSGVEHRRFHSAKTEIEIPLFHERARKTECPRISVLRFAVITTVTVTDPEQLRRAIKAVRNLHAGARLIMSRAYGQQGAAFSAGLGLGILLPDHVTMPKVLTE